MDFSKFIQQFAERFGIEVPEIVDEAAAFDADGMPFFLMRVAKEGESEYLVVAADLGEPPPGESGDGVSAGEGISGFMLV